MFVNYSKIMFCCLKKVIIGLNLVFFTSRVLMIFLNPSDNTIEKYLVSLFVSELCVLDADIIQRSHTILFWK